MLICCLISLSLFVAFIIGYMIVNRCPESLSATYYVMSHRWLFPTTLGVCSALIMVPMFDITPERLQCLVFFTIAGALFVSASPAFHSGLDKSVHYVSAGVMSASIVVWITLMGYIPYFVIVGVMAGAMFRGHFVFLSELGIMSNVYFVVISELV